MQILVAAYLKLRLRESMPESMASTNDLTATSELNLMRSVRER